MDAQQLAQRLGCRIKVGRERPEPSACVSLARCHDKPGEQSPGRTSCPSTGTVSIQADSWVRSSELELDPEPTGPQMRDRNVKADIRVSGLGIRGHTDT